MNCISICYNETTYLANLFVAQTSLKLSQRCIQRGQQPVNINSQYSIVLTL